MNSPREPGFIAFYGTLLRDGGAQERLGIRERLRWAGSCRIPGALVDLGEFPGLLPEPGVIEGEYYQILDRTVLDVLDEYEGFHPDGDRPSLFVRRSVRLLEPDLDAWVYFYHGPAVGKGRIRDGRWRPRT